MLEIDRNLNRNFLLSGDNNSGKNRKLQQDGVRRLEKSIRAMIVEVDG